MMSASWLQIQKENGFNMSRITLTLSHKMLTNFTKVKYHLKKENLTLVVWSLSKIAWWTINVVIEILKVRAREMCILRRNFVSTKTWIFLPGTYFMVRLQEQLKYFVHNKLSTDKLWQNVRVYLSGHEVRCGSFSASWSRNSAACRAAAVQFLQLSLCVPCPHRLQVRESIRSWSSFAPRAQGQIITQTPDTVSTVWMLTW